MCRVGEDLAVDGRNFGGVGAIDSHEDDTTGRGAIRTGVDNHILHGAAGMAGGHPIG